MAIAPTKKLLRVLAGETADPPPWWLMRQAGRYLPEYRAVRAKAADFVELCLTPALAAEVTLQPVRRFGMDAAILFADILLVPYAMGQSLAFGDEGPVLAAISDTAGLASLTAAGAAERLAPVYETICRVKAALPAETTLIGFAGSPWTVATYMVEGGSSRDFRNVKSWAYRDPDGFAALIELIGEATIAYLAAQITAGVEAVQLFDSWAGVLPEAAFERWVIEPTARIAAALRARFPQVPIIGFPRAAGAMYERYVEQTGVSGISVDTALPLADAQRLQRRCAVQGNLDPVLLTVGGPAMERGVARLRSLASAGPYVFNLGHGVLQQTPPEHVAALARLLTQPVRTKPVRSEPG